MNIRGGVNGVAARGGTRKSGVERFDEAQRCLGALARLPPRPETIAVERVVGSVDAAKAASLRPDFLPRRLGAQSPRYREVEEAMYTGTPLPAIEVYGLDGAYYVLDGHHRVAAARAWASSTSTRSFTSSCCRALCRAAPCPTPGSDTSGRPSLICRSVSRSAGRAVAL